MSPTSKYVLEVTFIKLSHLIKLYVWWKSLCSYTCKNCSEALTHWIRELIKLTRAAIMKLVCLGQMNCKRRWPSITALIILCNLPQPWFIFRNSCILVSILAPVLCVLIPLSGVDGAIVSGLLVCRRTPLCHCPNVRLPVKTAFQRLPVFHHNCTLARTTTRVHCSGCIWLWSD